MHKRISHSVVKKELLKNKTIDKAYRDTCLELELLEKMLKARKRAGLTQADLAEAMGTSTSVIGRLETGGGSKGHSPSISTLQNYAKAMGYRLKIDFVRENRSQA